MGLFDLLKPRDIGEGVKTCKATAGAVLLDVREPDEYAAGQPEGRQPERHRRLSARRGTGRADRFRL